MKKVTLFDIIREYNANLEAQLTAAEARWWARFNSPEERLRRRWFAELEPLEDPFLEDE